MLESFQNQKIQIVIDEINNIISQLEKLKLNLTMPEGTYFRIIKSDSFCHVDIWDTENEAPRVLCSWDENVPDDIFIKNCCRALTFLTPRAKKKPVYWKTNSIKIIDLPNEFHEFKKVFNIQEDIILENEINQLKAEYYATYHMSELNEVSRSN